MSDEVRLLGRPRITVGGRSFEPPPDRRSALLYYVAHAGGWVPRDDLLYLFWPDSEEHKGRANLRQLLMVVREAAFGTGLDVERTRVRWPVRTDLTAWHEAVSAGRAELRWPGPLLEGFRLTGAPEFESWLEIERVAWSERFRTALLGPVGEAGAADAEAAEFATRLESWLAQSPLDEEALRAWLRAAARAGRRTAALARFTTFEARLREEMGVAPEPDTVALVERLRREGDADAAASQVVAAPGRSEPERPAPAPRRLAMPLERPAGPFVGRGAEIERLAQELLAGYAPVVTVLAPGGMGKTRLAREAAERLAPHFADGVVFVSLADTDDVAGVAPAIAEALGLAAVQQREGTEQVEEALRDRHLLVVLDNLEQLPGVASLVERWRTGAADVAWLLTSRVLVGVRGESVVELGGLQVPEADAPASRANPAIDLLLRRARRAGRDLDPERDGPDLVRVARLTGGMPLAIELAAGWLRVLPLAAVADELEAGLDLLEAPHGGDDARHASLRPVFDAAWAALSDGERAALARLAVFRGGFDERAAREAAGVGRPLLLALRNRAMLTLEPSGRVGTHPLLETYLRERAAADAEAFADAEERHARYFLDLLAHGEDAGQAGAGKEVLAALRAEHPNLEAAWATAIDRGWWRPLVKGGAMFGISYEAAGRGARWGELLRDALARVPRGTLPWAMLEIHEASLDAFAERHELAYVRRSQAVDVLRPLLDREPLAWAWGQLLLGQSAWAVDRPEEAVAAFEAAAEAYERAGAPALVDLALANRLACTVDPDERERWHDALLRHHAIAGTPTTLTEAETDQALYLAAVHGEHGRAIALVERSMVREREQGYFANRMAELHLLAAELKAQGGDVAAAIELIDAFLEIWRPYWISQPRGGGEARALRALIAMERGEAIVEELLRPDGDAARTHRGLLLRADLAWRRGAFEEARGCVTEARARIQDERVALDRAHWLVRATLTSAEVSLAAGAAAGAAGEEARAGAERTRAAAELRGAIDLALTWHLLPALLHALAVSLPLLPGDLEAVIGAYAAGHPAASIGVRRRLAHVPPASVASHVPADRAAVWDEACRVARRVSASLEAPAGRVPGGPGQDPSR